MALLRLPPALSCRRVGLSCTNTSVFHSLRCCPPSPCPAGLEPCMWQRKHVVFLCHTHGSASADYVPPGQHLRKQVFRTFALKYPFLQLSGHFSEPSAALLCKYLHRVVAAFYRPAAVVMLHMLCHYAPYMVLHGPARGRRAGTVQKGCCGALRAFWKNFRKYQARCVYIRGMRAIL